MLRACLAALVAVAGAMQTCLVVVQLSQQARQVDTETMAVLVLLVHLQQAAVVVRVRLAQQGRRWNTAATEELVASPQLLVLQRITPEAEVDRRTTTRATLNTVLAAWVVGAMVVPKHLRHIP